jgi:ribonuclease BN (tRNA processing enzyme)
MESMKAAFGKELLDPPPPITITELAQGQSVTLADGVTLHRHKVPHTDESVAYSVTGRGRRVVVSGDTGFYPGLGVWAQGCDVLLCECSLPEAMALPTHLTPRQCGAIAAVAQPKRLVLTHFYPPVEKEDIVAQVAEHFGGPVECSHDGWSLDLGEGES